MNMAAVDVNAIPTKNKLKIRPIEVVENEKSSLNLTARVDSRERISKSPIKVPIKQRLTLRILSSELQDNED